MDPLANLAEQRELATNLLDQLCSGVPDDPDEAEALGYDVAQLCELVLTLDTWRIKGGADPYTQAKEAS